MLKVLSLLLISAVLFSGCKKKLSDEDKPDFYIEYEKDINAKKAKKQKS
jgi:hypothetical protein